MRPRSLACFVLFSLFSVLVPITAGAQIVIDSFTTRQSTIGFTPDTSTVLGSGILGGERDINSFLSMTISGQAPYRLSVACPPSLGTAAGGDLVYDGVDQSAISGVHFGLGSIDLTGGGRYDRLRFEVESVSPYTWSTMLIQVRQYDFMQGGSGSCYTLDLSRSLGTVEIPFSEFLRDTSVSFSRPVDFQNVGYIALHFETGPGASFVLGGISATPEPSALALLGCGAVGFLLTSRNRRRRCH